MPKTALSSKFLNPRTEHRLDEQLDDTVDVLRLDDGLPQTAERRRRD